MKVRRHTARAGLIVVAIVTGLGFATPGLFAKETATWKDLAAVLQDASGVADMDGYPAEGQFLSTLLRPVPGEERLILVYQRIAYDGAKQPQSRQIINYTFEWNDLDAATIQLVPWEGQYTGEDYFLVSIRVDPKREFIPYSNLVEQRRASGDVDVTGSRGKMRTIVLGYFLDRDTAERFTGMLREVLAAIKRPTAPERPDQSAASV
jgi:hypothetical protein